MEAALGANIEVLFQKLFVEVSHFVMFCNFVDILDVALQLAPAASKVKIEIRGFLQMKRTIAITALEKLLTPRSLLLLCRFLFRAM